MRNELEEVARALRSDGLTRTALADGSGVILHLDGAEVYSLNETGMFLVERLCDGEASADDLVREMQARFEIDETVARRDLEQFLGRLHGLLCG